MSHTIRWSRCPLKHGPATEEVAFVPQNSGPGMSVRACEECAQTRQQKQGRK